jgi:hypothetical protein
MHQCNDQKDRIPTAHGIEKKTFSSGSKNLVPGVFLRRGDSLVSGTFCSDGGVKEMQEEQRLLGGYKDRRPRRWFERGMRVSTYKR